jgi:hypothetical protein
MVCYPFCPFDGAKVRRFYEPAMTFWQIVCANTPFIDTSQRIAPDCDFCGFFAFN